MSFLANIGNIATNAVSRALGKESLNLPFTIGEPISDQDQSSFWTVHKGAKKEDNTPITVFIFDCLKNKDKVILARNALKRFKTLRHPDLLKFIDGGESALKFINQDCSLTHGNVRISSIYTTKAGEWRYSHLHFSTINVFRICGFELLGSLKEEGSILFEWGPRIIESRYTPPELSNSNWFSAQGNPVSAIDAYAYGCLIYEVFNGTFSRREDLSRMGSIPKPSPLAELLEQGLQNKGYFANEFIKGSIFLEQFSVKDAHEKEQFLNLNLSTPLSLEAHPPRPSLKLLKSAKRLTPEEYEIMVVPSIIRLFALQDRAMRVTLCENLGSFSQHISNKLATEKIFPNLATGFMDTSAVVREATLKAVLVLIPKLSERIINNDLLRFLAKLQTDEEAGIRANTTICLGKLSKHLNDSTRKRVLIPAFSRSLNDPFPPARNAGLLALAATVEVYEPEDVARKIMPAISFLLVDPEKVVRTQAFKNIDLFIKRLERHAQSIPEVVPELPTSPPRVGDRSDASSTDGWAGWAIGAISNRIVATATGTLTQPVNTPTPSASRLESSSVSSSPRKPESPSFAAAVVPAKSSFSAAASDEGGWDDEQDDWGKNDDWTPPTKNPVFSTAPKPVAPTTTTTTSSFASPPSFSRQPNSWDAKPAPVAKPAPPPLSPTTSLGGEDEKEAARRAKREQLAALREQKKAALAAKKAAMGS
ncbi:hypothetical protein BC829DRAFT_413744 [Chytridium lagenaria]|nr:hypothetical protein BC829DRAFT_413744 [Chytridium lagenaria]